jgi:Tfp pilus assembly protein PilF
VANADATARAWRFIEFGDRYFTRQDYRQANQRYKEAAEAAPNLAEAYLRQGQAMLATGQHAIAAVSFKRALKMAPDWSRVRFDIAELYADRAAARKAHLENLAQAAEQDPGNADLWLLLGIELHFSGEPDRARPFFERAADVLAADDPELARVVAGLATGPIAADGGEQDEEGAELRF